MEQSDYIAERIDAGAHLLPPYMADSAKRYILKGIPPGSFLTAVICNDLREAFARADDTNAAMMHNWVRFFYNHAPCGCWGSPERYSNWLAKFREQEA